MSSGTAPAPAGHSSCQHAGCGKRLQKHVSNSYGKGLCARLHLRRVTLAIDQEPILLPMQQAPQTWMGSCPAMMRWAWERRAGLTAEAGNPSSGSSRKEALSWKPAAARGFQAPGGSCAHACGQWDALSHGMHAQAPRDPTSVRTVQYSGVMGRPQRLQGRSCRTPCGPHHQLKHRACEKQAHPSQVLLIATTIPCLFTATPYSHHAGPERQERRGGPPACGGPCTSQCGGQAQGLGPALGGQGWVGEEGVQCGWVRRAQEEVS